MTILIADAGGTSTQWCLVNHRSTHQFTTEGINPSFTSDAEMGFLIEQAAKKVSAMGLPEQIYFYGAGCRPESQKKRVKGALTRSFPEATATVFTDLEGAARALYGTDSGLVLILGTGANSGYYNGENILQNKNHLGFLLGDEGSGAWLGKTWLKAWITENAPTDLRRLFENQYQLSPPEALSTLYQTTHPNRYAADFAPFLKKHRQHPFIEHLLYNSFTTLCKTYLLKYPPENRQTIRAAGGIAIHFHEELLQVFKDHHLTLNKVTHSPTAGLIRYHKLMHE